MNGRLGGGLLLLLLSVSLGAQYKPWYSYDNFAFGVKALGMGNAFTAVADDPTSAFWNPAGLAELRMPTLALSYRTNQLDYRYDPEQRTRYEVTETYDYAMEAHLRHLDFFAVTVPARIWDLEWTFGVSYYPYLLYGFQGSSTSTLTSSSPDVAPESTVTDLDGANGNDVLAFSAAFRIPRLMAVGITLQQFFNTGSSRIRYEKDGANHDDTYDERVSGRNLIFGALFTPVERVRFGIAYHAGLKNKLSSRYSSLVSTETATTTASDSALADITLPDHFSLGLAVTPWPALTLSLEHSKVLWSKGQVVNYYRSTALPYPIKDHFSFTQQDIVNYRFGVEGRIPVSGRTLQLRGGAFADRQLYVDQAGGSITLHGFTVGAGMDLSPSLRLEASLLRQRANWQERGNLLTDATVASHFESTSLVFGVTYVFRTLARGAE